jgi:hypothetical protein
VSDNETCHFARAAMVILPEAAARFLEFNCCEAFVQSIRNAPMTGIGEYYFRFDA